MERIHDPLSTQAWSERYVEARTRLLWQPRPERVQSAPDDHVRWSSEGNAPTRERCSNHPLAEVKWEHLSPDSRLTDLRPSGSRLTGRQARIAGPLRCDECRSSHPRETQTRPELCPRPRCNLLKQPGADGSCRKTSRSLRQKYRRRDAARST